MNYLKNYHNWLKLKDLSDNTIQKYLQQIKCFLKDINITNISEENIRNYLLKIKTKFAKETYNKYLTSIKSFLKFLNKDINLPKQLKIDKKLPEFITLNQLEKEIIPMIDLIFKNPIKIKTILYFMFFSGIRVGEISLLKRKNFNLKNKSVKIYEPKTKKERIIYYNKKTKNFIEMLFSLEIEKNNAFNANTNTIQNYLRKLNPYIKDINLHAHLFRHSFANHYLTKGGDLITLKELLGHFSIQSTMRYAGLNNEQLKNKYNQIIK